MLYVSKKYQKIIQIFIKKLSIFFRGSIWKCRPSFSLIHTSKSRPNFHFFDFGLTFFGPLFFLFFIKNFLWFFSKNMCYSPWYNIRHYLKKSENFCKNLVKNKKYMLSILQNVHSVYTHVHTCIYTWFLHFFADLFLSIFTLCKKFLGFLFFNIYI